MIDDWGHFYQKRYRGFKIDYSEHVTTHLWSDFPKQIRYRRLIQLMPPLLIGLCESLHRSLVGFMVNVLGGLIAYCLQPKKFTLDLEFLYAIVFCLNKLTLKIEALLFICQKLWMRCHRSRHARSTSFCKPGELYYDVK